MAVSKYVRRGLNWYSDLWPKGSVKPPYKHITQIGDPVLRKKCEHIPLAAITSKDIQSLIMKMRAVMKDFDCVGLSASQIGVDKRLFIMELTEKQLKHFTEHEKRTQEIFIIPSLVFINPIMKVIDSRKVIHKEACASIKCFHADVPRNRSVQIHGYDENGKEVEVKFTGWSSRIAQHEMDHLDGTVYTDIMIKETLTCAIWQQINMNEGKVRIPFTSE